MNQKKIIISQEEIYQLLYKEDWKQLVDVFYDNRTLIKTDPLLHSAFETTIQVLSEKATSLENTEELVDNFENIIQMDSNGFIALKDFQKEAITIGIVKGTRKKLPYSYNYAKKYPKNDICKEVIEEFELKSNPVSKPSQPEIISVTENEDVDLQIDFRKSLFNSRQEVEFFLALKRVFDSYQVYPNVGLSSILIFDEIKDKLTSKEREFFFRTSVDFVVLEPFKNYFPIYFFEIDSIWHDSEEQIEKDKMKDKIFSISGQKLVRIRKINNSIGEKEFEELIQEIRKETE